MKHFILTIGILAFSLNSLANKELAGSMKIMGEQFKIIVDGVQSKKLTSLELDAIKVLQEAITTASSEIPNLATTAESQKQFMTLMNDLMKMSLTLESQAEEVMGQSPQDLTEVTNTLRAMVELRKEGHNLFKED